MASMRILLASPFAGDIEANVAYAREAMRHAIIEMGETPIVPHLLYPQALDDTDPGERSMGMECGIRWLAVADWLVVYEDLGISPGMRVEIEHATSLGKTIIYRRIRSE